MAEVGLSTGKTICILAIVVACFAILWPKIFYPMLSNPSKIQNSQDCCNVIFDKDVNAIKIMTELCEKILYHEEDYKTRLTFAFRQGKLTKEIVFRCKNQVLHRCDIDITEFLSEKVRLGKDYKQILADVRSLNSSFCLKENFGVTLNDLGAPRHIKSWSFTQSNHLKQERPPTMRPGIMHPALLEKGRAIPHTHVVPNIIEREGKPPILPGMRPVMGGAGHTTPARGGNNMSFIMPIYTIAIVIFFMYTMMKILVKRSEQNNAYRDYVADEEFRRMVYHEYGGFRNSLSGDNNETYHPSCHSTRNKEVENHPPHRFVVNAISGLIEEVKRDIIIQEQSEEFGVRAKQPELEINEVDGSAKDAKQVAEAVAEVTRKDLPGSNDISKNEEDERLFIIYNERGDTTGLQSSLEGIEGSRKFEISEEEQFIINEKAEQNELYDDLKVFDKVQTNENIEENLNVNETSSSDYSSFSKPLESREVSYEEDYENEVDTEETKEGSYTELVEENEFKVNEQENELEHYESIANNEEKDIHEQEKNIIEIEKVYELEEKHILLEKDGDKSEEKELYEDEENEEENELKFQKDLLNEDNDLDGRKNEVEKTKVDDKQLEDEEYEEEEEEGEEEEEPEDEEHEQPEIAEIVKHEDNIWEYTRKNGIDDIGSAPKDVNAEYLKKENEAESANWKTTSNYDNETEDKNALESEEEEEEEEDEEEEGQEEEEDRSEDEGKSIPVNENSFDQILKTLTKNETKDKNHADEKEDDDVDQEEEEEEEEENVEDVNYGVDYSDYSEEDDDVVEETPKQNVKISYNSQHQR